MAKTGTAKQKDGFLDTVRTVIYAILIAVVFRTLLFQPFWIPSGSMKSTLLIGDYLFISKYSYGYSKHSFPFSFAPFEGRIWDAQPERGDVIVFKHPRTGEDYIKRLIGVPGDRVQMREGRLFLNGEPVKRERTEYFVEDIDPARTRCSDTPEIDGVRRCVKDAFIETLPGGRSYMVLNADGNSGPSDNTRIYTVPAGHFFFVGDNRDNSSDSRASEGVGFVPYENLVGRAELIALSSDGPFYQIWNWRFDRFLTLVR